MPGRSRVDWTPERVERVHQLRMQAMSVREIALVLTQEWRVRVTFSMISSVYDRFLNDKPKPDRAIKRVRATAHTGSEAEPSRLCFRPATGKHPTLTGRLMGDPPPGRTAWA